STSPQKACTRFVIPDFGIRASGQLPAKPACCCTCNVPTTSHPRWSGIPRLQSSIRINPAPPQPTCPSVPAAASASSSSCASSCPNSPKDHDSASEHNPSSARAGTPRSCAVFVPLSRPFPPPWDPSSSCSPLPRPSLLPHLYGSHTIFFSPRTPQSSLLT